MLSGEGDENGEKTTIVLISKKGTLHVQHTFFAHFFAVVLHDYKVKSSRNFLVTRFMEEMSYVFFCSLFFFHYLFFSLSFAGLSPTFFFFLSFSFSIFQVCGRDN